DGGAWQAIDTRALRTSASLREVAAADRSKDEGGWIRPLVLNPVRLGAEFGKSLPGMKLEGRAILMMVGERSIDHVHDGRIVLMTVQTYVTVWRHRDPAHPKLAGLQAPKCLGEIDRGEQRLLHEMITPRCRALPQGKPRRKESQHPQTEPRHRK